MDMLPKKILVVFSNIDTTHRLMLAGILRYVREKCTPAWQVQLDLRDISRRNPSEIVSGGFAGIVASIAFSFLTDDMLFFVSLRVDSAREDGLGRADVELRAE